jgi:8-oxo-dGTP pyrophosphatase MutT (NUDIX family)
MPEPPVIAVVAALITDPAGRLLLVRKRGTDSFMQAGGKPEAGESARAALVRELEEELRLDVDEDDLEELRTFETAAANEPGFLVRADVFRLRIDSSPAPASEIEEVRWASPADARALGQRLAPLARVLLEHL